MSFFALLTAVALPLAAQTVRFGPEHIIPPPAAPSGYGQMIALLPHGDGAVAFWGRGGALHAVVLDPFGNVVSESVVPEISGAESGWASVARAGDGYLVVNIVPLNLGCLAGTTVATRLDGDFHVRGASVELGVDLVPNDLACNATDCAVSLMHIKRTDCSYDDDYVSLLALDGSVIKQRLTLPVTSWLRLTATSRGFIGSFTDDQQGFHTIAFDADGTARTVSDFGKLPRYYSVGGVTAVGDGAIVAWPIDQTLRAARLGSDGAVIDTRTIATFTYDEFEDVRVACAGAECTAAVEWYPEGVEYIDGAFFPIEEIHAVRFTTALDPIDANPVTIAKPSENEGLQIAATSAGGVIGWSAFAGSTPRVAFLAHGNASFAGDIELPGMSINSGLVDVRSVATTRNAIAWSDLSADKQRGIRFTHLDDDGVPVEAAPLVLQHDRFSDRYGGSDDIVLGNDGDSYAAAWHSDYTNVTIARPGAAESQKLSGRIVLPMLTDGRESVLVVREDQTDNVTIRRITGGRLSQPQALLLRDPSAGALSNGRLFLQGEYSTEFRDLDANRSVSTPAANLVALSALAFGERNVLSFTDALDEGYGSPAHMALQRFSLDGQLLDAQRSIIGGYGSSLAAVPLGSRFLIAWDVDPYAYQGGTISIAVVDPDTRSVSPPTVIANDGRYLVGLVSRDATHVLAVFTKRIKIGEDYPNSIITQLIEVVPDSHHLRRRALN